MKNFLLSGIILLGLCCGGVSRAAIFTAEGGGDAVEVFDSAEVSGKDTQIIMTNNTTDADMASVSVNSYVLFENNEIVDNTYSSAPYNGGMIYSSYGNFLFGGENGFNENKVHYDFSATHLIEDATVATFEVDSGVTVKGGLVHAADSTFSFDDMIDFSQNEVSVTNRDVSLSNFIGTSNNTRLNALSLVEGGMIYSLNSDFGFLGSSMFSDNKVSIMSSDFVVNGDNNYGVMYGNSDIYGGMIYAEDSNFGFDGVTEFSDNEIMLETSLFTGSSNNALFSAMVANLKGGLIYADNSGFTFGEYLSISDNFVVLQGNLVSSSVYSVGSGYTDLRTYAGAEVEGGLVFVNESQFSFAGTNNIIGNELSIKRGSARVVAEDTGSSVNAGSAAYVTGGLLSFVDSEATFDESFVATDNSLIISEGASTIEASDVTKVSSSVSSEVFGGIWNSEDTTTTFNGDVSFESNSISVLEGTINVNAGGLLEASTIESLNTAFGGIFANNGGSVDFGGTTVFANNEVSINASSVDVTADDPSLVKVDTSVDVYGGIVANAINATMKFGGAYFRNNSVKAMTGAVTGDYGADVSSAKVYGGAVYNDFATIDFNGNAEFVNNVITAEALSDGQVVDAHGAAIYMGDASSQGGGTINFATMDDEQYILFEGNKIMTKLFGDSDYTVKLNSIHLATADQTVNFMLRGGTYADIRDPITGMGVINKDMSDDADGDGGLYLWGDNNEFTGELNIKAGSFYAMFDADSEVTDDPLGQRKEFKLDNATVTFADNTFFRPMMNDDWDKLAQLNMATTGQVTVGDNVKLVPYEISSLDVDHYSFDNNYAGFDDWDNDLASLTINGEDSVELTIKRDLTGYDSLSAFADVYRRDDLTYSQREEVDNIYATGEVSEDFKSMVGILEGVDVMNVGAAQRISIRQFGRQIKSRIQNKDYPFLGPKQGFAGNHAWFDIGHNWIEQDGDENSLGYKYRPTSYAIGYDQDIIPNKMYAGIAFGYTYGDAVTKKGVARSNTRISEYLVSLYGKYKPLRYYISGTLGGGFIRNNGKFKTVNIDSKSTYDSYAGFASLETGYDFGTRRQNFEPYVGVEYAYLRTDSYDERGTSARHFDSIDWNIIEVPVGLRMSKDMEINRFLFTPMVDLAYSHNFGDTDASTNAHFVGGTERWRVVSSSEKRDSFRGALNLKVNSLDYPVALNLGYAIDYRTDYTDQQIYATVRCDF